MLEELKNIENILVTQLQTSFQRYLLNEINLRNKLIVISEARGAGKTTLLLQILKQSNLPAKQKLYFSADNILVASLGLFRVAREFHA
ncbi:hypothetical protein JNK13_01125 [bacterium]|nr:hypothetical protein [bacterium]